METEARFVVQSDAELAALAGLGSLGGFTLSPATATGLKALAGMKPRAAGGALHVRAEHETPIGAGVDARRPARWPGRALFEMSDDRVELPARRRTD
jgi:hypothetical protein